MSAVHPLDPLSTEEIALVREAILAAPEHVAMPSGARFITVETRLPEKAALEARAQAVDAGDPAPEIARQADVVLLDRGDASTHEVIVDLADATIAGWRHLEGIQPLAVVEELAEAEELVKRDPGFQAGAGEARRNRLRARCRSTPGRPGTSARPRSRTAGSPAASPSSARAPVTANGRTRSTG